MSNGKDQSVAPKERVNITYKAPTGDGQEETELPLKVLMVGDFTGRADDTPLEDRKPVNVDRENFNDVLASQKLGVALNVPNRLVDEKDASMSVELRFERLDDFTPEGVVNQVPELKQLLELRSALTALKGPLGNIPAFRKKIEALLGDEEKRAKLMKELGLGE
jgi:type VI secretion system protein ImpB